jgi:FlaG/FlaF family flagellin (archaellin)
MSLATFDGYNFSDLSSDIPNQWDAILYANAWNGQYWLVGGGWEGNEGVIFRYNGTNLTDLSFQLHSVIPHSVQAIGWNGEYWLIGGVGFLVKYDGQNFTDLTPELDKAINPRNALNYTECCNSVNALKWNGNSWVIGGGAPVAITEPLTAWIATYNHGTFTDLSSLLPAYVINPAQNSSVLSVTYANESWFIGGYANDHGMLLAYANSTITDLSYLVDNSMSTVNWVGGAEVSGQNISRLTSPYHATANVFQISNTYSTRRVFTLQMAPYWPDYRRDLQTCFSSIYRFSHSSSSTSMLIDTRTDTEICSRK